MPEKMIVTFHIMTEIFDHCIEHSNNTALVKVGEKRTCHQLEVLADEYIVVAIVGEWCDGVGSGVVGWKVV